MSFEHLLRGTSESRPVETKPVSPTLMIGLGGTGKEILLRFRRLVVERYGNLSALPFLQFMHVDTDMTANALEQYDLPSSGDPLYDSIRFKPSERIDLTIEGGTGKYVAHIGAYPHIQRWFPTSGKIAGLGNLGEGAGQVRVASRLGFYHAANFQKITSSLDHARRNLSDPKIANRVGDLGFEFDATSMDIFVICSIAGGTGGGTYLDMGFLLKRYFAKASTSGILLLPSFFAGYAGGQRVQANGYAALMETNHHAFGNPFVSDWDGNQAELLPPPPFDVTYLIDGTNEAGLGIPSNGGEYDAYQMIADVLYQDYSLGSFAGKKRATRINLVNFSLGVYTHNFLNDALRSKSSSDRTVVGDTFPTRFGSFGFSAIRFPVDRVHAACGARLASDVLDRWGSTLLDDPLERLFTKFLSDDKVRFAQGRFERRDGGGIIDRSDVEDALSVYQDEGGKTFQSFLWEKAGKIRQLVEAAAVSEKTSVLEQQLAELNRLFASEDSEDADEWGVGVRQLESNYRHYETRVKEGIEALARSVADDPKYGVAYTLSLLRELKSLLRNENFRYFPHFEAEIEYWRDQIQDHGYDVDQFKLDMARHEGELLFRRANLRWDLDQLVQPDEDSDPGALYSYYYSRVMKQVAKRGKAICEEIDRFLGKDDVTGDGLLATFWNLLSGFGRLKQRLEQKYDYYRREPSSELVVSLYQESDCDEWYETWVGEGAERARTLEQVGNQLLQSIFDVETVTAAMAKIQDTPTDQLEEKVLAHCREYFVGQKRQPEALELLLGPRWEGQRKQMIKRAYDLSKVWLLGSQTGLGHIKMDPVTADQRPCLIGVDTGNSLRFPELQRIVNDVRAAQDSPPSFLNIGEANRGVILFYNELAGVPAFYGEAIARPGGMKSAYDRWEDKDDLHFDKNRFQFGDLIPKTKDEADRYAASIKAFVLGRVLGLLKVRTSKNHETGETISHYSFVRGGSLDAEDRDLGTEAQAIDALYRDTRQEHLTDRRQLLEAIEESIEQIRGQGLLWVYWLLLDFYMYVVHPPKRDEKWVANLTVVHYSPEHAVLAKARDQIREMLPTEEAQENLAKALEARRRGKQAEDLTYDDFLDALSGQVVMSGVVQVRTEALVLDKTTYLETPVFDRGKIQPTGRDFSKIPDREASQPREEKRTRPCPNCGSSIDLRAVYCTNCDRRVAEQEICSVCSSKVPGDLNHCWNCGDEMRKGEKIECPQCLAWEGYEGDFPCPQCGFDLIESSGDREAEKKPDKAAVEAEDEEGEESSAEPAEPEKIECPTCYMLVEPGPKCPVCNGLL